jgi:hypothetical protein
MPLRKAIMLHFTAITSKPIAAFKASQLTKRNRRRTFGDPVRVTLALGSDLRRPTSSPTLAHWRRGSHAGTVGCSQ